MRPTLTTLSKILPRSAVPEGAKVLPSALPTLNRARQPTVVEQLVQRKSAALEAGLAFPPNLRIERFDNTRARWQGVSRDVREELKKVIREK